MKTLKFLMLALLASATLMSCRPMVEKEIVGRLEVDQRWGDLDFTDATTKQKFTLASGIYRLTMPWAWPWSDPVIEIANARGAVMGHLTIPKKNIKSDGTFEIFDHKDLNGTNLGIMGGRRIMILGRARYARPHQSCTYTTTETISTTCSDGKGGSYSCTEIRTVTHSGYQDELWEKRRVKSAYRILFDAADLQNAAVFTAQSHEYFDEEMLNHTGCS